MRDYNYINTVARRYVQMWHGELRERYPNVPSDILRLGIRVLVEERLRRKYDLTFRSKDVD